jgi:hypothetical protein
MNRRDNRLVKRFVLDRTHPNVLYGCEVTLIKKNDKFERVAGPWCLAAKWSDRVRFNSGGHYP